jgi:hypothetical protein
MNTELMIDKIFNHLDEWRHLPAYQLERRTDIFFAIYLPDIIKWKFRQNIEHVVPEFPVRLGSLDTMNKHENPNHSIKIDYLAVCNESKTVYLIELKTDTSSHREKQDLYMEKAKEINVKSLIDGVLEIRKATSSSIKYDNLISVLAQIGWVDPFTLTNTSEDYNIEIIYIQPTKPDHSEKTIISFADIAHSLAERQDKLTQRFVKSLEKWKVNPNK